MRNLQPTNMGRCIQGPIGYTLGIRMEREKRRTDGVRTPYDAWPTCARFCRVANLMQPEIVTIPNTS